MKRAKIASLFSIQPGKKFRLHDFPTDFGRHKPLKHLQGETLTDDARADVQTNLDKLTRAQELLYANGTRSVLIVFQAMDAAGKDGMIKHVMSGLNPQGCQVFSFKKPSDEELQHTFLWRCVRCLPERGRIGIFNRSYYEEVLVAKVHPEILARQKLPPGKRGRAFWRQRYEDINQLEKHLAANGTLVLKFFLNLSKKEQKKRFLERLNQPEKNWKFSAADLAERRFWGQYMQAYEAAINATSTDWAPWFVIPADQKWVARAVVSAIVSHAIDSLRLQPPAVSPEQLKSLAAARRELFKS
jgi:PPK2 family polyphosphate:nucleotide phosphotransferase